MLRAHPLRLTLKHHLRSTGVSSHKYPYSTAATERPKDFDPKQRMSPAAIASIVHQHIAFGTNPWDVGKQEQERTSLGTSHSVSSYPVKTSPDEVHTPGFVKPLSGRNTSTGLPLKHPPRIPTSTTADLEVLADDLEAYATMTVPADTLPRIYGRQSLRPRLLSILAHTQDAACAWAAYRALLILPRSPEKPKPKVPFPHRHRLLRLLAASPPRPRNRGRFAQVLAVLRALQDAGGIVKVWEWNLLLDCVGKEGWRRPRDEHYRAALALLAEMRRGDGADKMSSTIAAAEGGRDGDSGSDGGVPPTLEPDIISYTTLLAHAVRTRAPAAVRHAAQLLARAGLAPGVHAHTVMLCFFARRGDLAGVRDMLYRMHQRARQDDGGAGLTQAPFNAVMWAFAYNRRLDVARAMYRVVRARVADEQGRRASEGAQGEEDAGWEEGGEEEGENVMELERALAEREKVVVAPEVVPDSATYHVLIQAHAYYGDLRASLGALADMLSARLPSPLGPGGQFIASLPAFRAIFLGFARHGVAADPPSPSSSSSSSSTTTTTTQKDHGPYPYLTFSHNSSSHDDSNAGENEWTLEALEALFARFLELPPTTRLRESILFWLVSAFARMSGHDATVLRRVFERVEDRFGRALTCGEPPSRRGRLARIRERVFAA
jgi:hypothetical protein